MKPANNYAGDAYVAKREYTIEPLIIESFWAKKRVSTRALGALDDPLVVPTNIWKSGRVPVDITQHL